MYCTLDDIKSLLPEDVVIQLTDDEGTGMVNDARVDEAIAQADAEIDSYCGARYSVPFASPPEVVNKLSVDIAIYNLYSRSAVIGKVPEVRAERYKNAIATLKDISAGVVSLGVDPAPDSASTGGGAETNKTTDGNVFTRSKMERF